LRGMGSGLAEADVCYQISVWQDTQSALHPTGKRPLPVPGVDLTLIHLLQHILPESWILFMRHDLVEPTTVSCRGPSAHINVVELPGAAPSSPRPNMN